MKREKGNHEQTQILFAGVFVILLFVSGMFPVNCGAAQGSVIEQAIWTGDLDVMKEKGAIRILVPVSNPFFLVDGFHKYGLIPDQISQFEEFLNSGEVTGSFLRLVTIPVSRDMMFDRLLSGYGDMVLANLTITPGRLGKVDFSDPIETGINQIVVASSDAAPLRSLEDLAGKTVSVRKISSYYNSLTMLNEGFEKKGLEPVKIQLMANELEDDLLLGMVNEGLLDYTVVDHWKPGFWEQSYPHYVSYPDIRVAGGTAIGWAMRKESPQLKDNVNKFVKYYRKKNSSNIRKLHEKSDKDLLDFSNLEGEMWDLFKDNLPLFEKIGDIYDIPVYWLAALAYVGSGFDQEKTGLHGQLGMMQLAPFIGRSPEVDIEDISQVEGNVEATAKYLRYLIDTHFTDGEIAQIDQRLFAVAAYFTGPEKISTMRWLTGQMGQNSNKWFNEVAVVVSRRMGRDTERFVMAVSGAALTYRLASESGKRKWLADE